MFDEFVNYVEEKKKRLAGNQRIAVVIEQPQQVLSDDAIDELVKLYARMVAYEYIEKHPELFEESDETASGVQNQDGSDTQHLYSLERCAIIGESQDGGNIKCVA